MAHFRGVLQGSRGPASRLAGKGHGLSMEAQSWEGAVTVELFHDFASGHDMAVVHLEPHHGVGVVREVFRGRVDGSAA